MVRVTCPPSTAGPGAGQSRVARATRQLRPQAGVFTNGREEARGDSRVTPRLPATHFANGMPLWTQGNPRAGWACTGGRMASLSLMWHLKTSIKYRL